ncbi:GNAT family N-acetyltransferase [Novosphingobium sp. 1949]|uniref:GNAT family N-acetyltransferase n=1 Tax=Novosphingobium organovorum TaxID=2930092 RepID=A0ABT0BD10_9SPHN|nr:GNAT family N-acetyltransferase [Novosphingobium organovorum]MCJ2182947.1 GNAT family N-acetyltransferase [Novosphingobium organovorum]
MATLPDNRLTLRAMENDDIPTIQAMAQAEQWPHRKQDLAAMLELGAGIIALVEGKVIGSAMWWLWGETQATLGMILVSRPFRGGGIGRIIMETALDQIGARTIQMLTTESGLPLARKFGFRGVSEVRQHQGTSFTAPLIPLAPDERIRPMGQSDIAPVAALAKAACGLDRQALVPVLFEKGHAVVLDRGGETIGFAFFRRFGRGYVIGPVVAPDIPRAKALIAQWLGARSGEFTRLDMIGECGLHDWLEDLGLIRINRFVTMVRGEEPSIAQPGQSFAITSQALF